MRKNQKFLNRSLPKDTKAKPKLGAFKTPKQSKIKSKVFNSNTKTSAIKMRNAEIQTNMTPFTSNSLFDYGDSQNKKEIGLPDINEKANMRSILEYMMPLALANSFKMCGNCHNFPNNNTPNPMLTQNCMHQYIDKNGV